MSFELELLAERALAEFSNQSRVSILSSPMRSPVKSFNGKSGFDFEYKGDDFQIPTGSSVIVKRVPGGAVPLSVVCHQTSALGVQENRKLQILRRDLQLLL